MHTKHKPCNACCFTLFNYFYMLKQLRFKLQLADHTVVGMRQMWLVNEVIICLNG